MNSHKKYTFLFLFSISFLSSYAQRKLPSLTAEQLTKQRQSWEQRGDSAIASREVVRMKRLFALTPEQEKAVFQVGINMNQSRRQVLKSYDRTDALQVQMSQVNKSADSVYSTIVGEKNYRLYKDAMHTPLAKLPSKRSIDSLHTKNQQP